MYYTYIVYDSKINLIQIPKNNVTETEINLQNNISM